MNWQHLNILAATNYLRERIASGVPDSKAKEVYDGLLDVLDPSRIERRAKAEAIEPVRLEADASQVRLKPDSTSQPTPPPQVPRPPAPSLKAPAKKAPAGKKKTSPPAKPARRRPARPARPAKPRRR